MMSKINGRTLKRMWVYLRRGQGTYFAFIISLLNFLVIQYNLLIVKVSFLRSIFPSFKSFIMYVLPVYIVFVMLIGYLDRKRGTLKEEVAILAEANPVLLEILRRLENIEKKIEKTGV